MSKKVHSIKSPPRELLADLKHYLIEHGFKPGDRIDTEVQLAKRFAVSRARIREATTTLCQLGVLESRPRRGTIIKSFDPLATGEHLGFHFAVVGLPAADSREARLIIERAILPLAVRRITPAGLEELKTAIRRMEAATNDREVYNADRDFHLALLRACGNQTLQAFSQVILGIFEQQYTRHHIPPEVLERSLLEHKELARKIEEGDARGAVQVLNQHLRRLVDSY